MRNLNKMFYIGAGLQIFGVIIIVVVIIHAVQIIGGEIEDKGLKGIVENVWEGKGE